MWPVSKPVIVGYQPRWANEFAEIRDRLADSFEDRALHIDHIGSTSVPGLAAKDIVDLQVIVESLDGLDDAFARAGLEARLGGTIVRDHVPASWEGDEALWSKRLYGAPRVNAHVRLAGSPNERYALLFRDYLRVHPEVRDRWAETKRRIAAESADIDAYLDVKDPLADVLMQDAEAWANATGWAVPAP
jgi:GrpB-like predicted nucleotidyltransferase (UPF0157 family)